MLPVPFVGGACNLARGIAKGDSFDSVLGGLSLGLDLFSVVGIPALDNEVSDLARNVQKRGTIVKGANFILKEFKCLRSAANVLNNLKFGA